MAKDNNKKKPKREKNAQSKNRNEFSGVKDNQEFNQKSQQNFE